MAFTGVTVRLGVVIAFAVNVWGLIHRDHSFLCAISGLTVLAAASLGAWHAWAESQSVKWTLLFCAAALTGLISLLRQFIIGSHERQADA